MFPATARDTWSDRFDYDLTGIQFTAFSNSCGLTLLPVLYRAKFSLVTLYCVDLGKGSPQPCSELADEWTT